MSNITFLKNLPNWITAAFKNAYINFESDDTAVYENWGEQQFMYPYGPKHFLPADLENLRTLGFYKLQIWKLLEPSESHYDVGRSVAFNFPIDCADDSVIYAAKDNCIDDIHKTAVDKSKTVSQDIAKKYPYKYSVRYEYNTNFYDSYSMEHPYLVNTSVPHGGHSESNTVRIFWTCSFDSNYTYYDLVDKFQIWQ